VPLDALVKNYWGIPLFYLSHLPSKKYPTQIYEEQPEKMMVLPIYREYPLGYICPG
jgi:hypothetical protein